MSDVEFFYSYLRETFYKKPTYSTPHSQLPCSPTLSQKNSPSSLLLPLSSSSSSPAKVNFCNSHQNQFSPIGGAGGHLPPPPPLLLVSSPEQSLSSLSQFLSRLLSGTGNWREDSGVRHFLESQIHYASQSPSGTPSSSSLLLPSISMSQSSMLNSEDQRVIQSHNHSHSHSHSQSQGQSVTGGVSLIRRSSSPQISSSSTSSHRRGSSRSIFTSTPKDVDAFFEGLTKDIRFILDTYSGLHFRSSKLVKDLTGIGKEDLEISGKLNSVGNLLMVKDSLSSISSSSSSNQIPQPFLSSKDSLPSSCKPSTSSSTTDSNTSTSKSQLPTSFSTIQPETSFIMPELPQPSSLPTILPTPSNHSLPSALLILGKGFQSQEMLIRKMSWSFQDLVPSFCETQSRGLKTTQGGLLARLIALSDYENSCKHTQRMISNMERLRGSAILKEEKVNGAIQDLEEVRDLKIFFAL